MLNILVNVPAEYGEFIVVIRTEFIEDNIGIVKIVIANLYLPPQRCMLT